MPSHIIYDFSVKSQGFIANTSQIVEFLTLSYFVTPFTLINNHISAKLVNICKGAVIIAAAVGT